MEVTLAVLADAANTTGSGKLNLLGVFQNISAKQVPCFHPMMTLAIMLRADLGDKGTAHTLQIDVLDDEARDLTSSPEIGFEIPTGGPQPNPEFALAIRLPNFMLPKFGQYIFTVLIDGVQLRQIFLTVQPIILTRP